MKKNNYLHDNFCVNFRNKGFTSMLIGAYLMGASYLIESILNGFQIDDNPLGMMSAEIIEMVVLFVIVFVFLFSSFALYFSGRRCAKKLQNKLFNGKTKTALFKYLLISILGFITIYALAGKGFIDYLTPAFLLFYAFLFFALRSKKRKQNLILIGLAVLLAVYCFLIPSYWSASLTILGIAHITYGVVVRN
jgi:magnesium-transporting ATPase (P-type)